MSRLGNEREAKQANETIEPQEQLDLKEKIIANLETFRYKRDTLRSIWKTLKHKWQD